MPRPKDKRILTLDKNISDMGEYIRHKEHCQGYNESNADWEAHIKGADILKVINDGLLPCDQSKGTVYKLWSPEATAQAIKDLLLKEE